MKFLYVTDLHGRTEAYDTALERALAEDASAIVNGGDLYPVGPDLFRVQKEFLECWFSSYLARVARSGLKYISTLGNMDLRGHDNLFRRVMSESGCGICLLDESAEIQGWTFTGSPLTTDAPFALKDRCRRDTPDSQTPPVDRTPVLSDPEGIKEAPDWNALVLGLPTLGQCLDNLTQSGTPERNVLILHQPPHGLGQGIIQSGQDVGSIAVREFLERRNPWLSLHGHIHESPYCGGSWRSTLGDTVCVQPGQLSGDCLVSVTVNLETREMRRVE